VKRAILFIFILLGTSNSSKASESRVPFKLYRGYLIAVKCSVGDQQNLIAILDTGTTETILDFPTVNRLSLKTWADSATAVTKDTPVRGVSIPDFQLGPLRVRQLEGIAMDLTSIGRELGIRPDLVIGMDVLHRMSFVIDYKSQVITFGHAATMAHSAALAPGLRFALIDSNVLGKPQRLQVDTGFNGLLLFGQRPEEFAARPPGDTGARVAGVAQTTHARSVESPEVLVGNWRASHMMVTLLDRVPRDVTEFDGLFGPRLLGTRRVAFDFDHRMLYWD
jgi:predicted aspartyl protease